MGVVVKAQDSTLHLQSLLYKKVDSQLGYGKFLTGKYKSLSQLYVWDYLNGHERTHLYMLYQLQNYHITSRGACNCIYTFCTSDHIQLLTSKI